MLILLARVLQAEVPVPAVQERGPRAPGQVGVQHGGAPAPRLQLEQLGEAQVWHPELSAPSSLTPFIMIYGQGW